MSRLLTTGFEFSNYIDNGILSIDSEVSISSLYPRKSAGGNGGLFALEANTTGSNDIDFQVFPYSISESYTRFYFRLQSLPSSHEYIFYDNSGSSEIFKLTLSGTGPFVLNVNGSDVATGSKTILPNIYYYITIDSVISGSGSITLSIDGASDISYSGATNGGGSSWNQLKLSTDGHVYYDDFAINDSYTRVNYTSGNGVSSPSGTLTSSTATASIIYHVGDGTDGYFIINNSGTSFSDSETITDSSTFSATTFGAEDDSNTSSVSEGFVQLFYPDGNGNYSQLTNSDDNSTNNYSYINSYEDISDFVYGESAGLKDTYTMSNLPSEAVSINHINSCYYTKRDGSSISNLRSLIRIGSTDYPTYQQNIPGSFRWVKFPLPENPDTNDPWDISEINNAEIGPQIES